MLQNEPSAKFNFRVTSLRVPAAALASTIILPTSHEKINSDLAWCPQGRQTSPVGPPGRPEVEAGDPRLGWDLGAAGVPFGVGRIRFEYSAWLSVRPRVALPFYVAPRAAR